MKKPARKKSPKEREDVSEIVSEIVEESEKKQNVEAPDTDEPSNKDENEAVVKEEEKEVEDEPEKEKDAEEVTRRASFYEKVMGEKPHEVSEDAEAEKGERSINSKLFLLGAFVFVLTVLIASMVGLAILNKDTLLKQLTKKTVKPTPTIAIPTPTPVSISREEWKFEVLNGSDTSGVAAKGAEKIKALGYKVTRVGNADGSVDSAQISLSKDVNESEKKTILEDLKIEFGEITVGEELPDAEKTVRLILVK